MGTHRTPQTQPHFPEGFLSTSAEPCQSKRNRARRPPLGAASVGRGAEAPGSGSTDGIRGAGETVSGLGEPEGPVEKVGTSS